MPVNPIRVYLDYGSPITGSIQVNGSPKRVFRYAYNVPGFDNVVYMAGVDGRERDNIQHQLTTSFINRGDGAPEFVSHVAGLRG